MSIQQTRDGVAPRKQTDDFEKSVEYVAKDEEEQIAYGAVMVPGELDLQGDFIRASALLETASGFKSRAESGDAHLGVMHAVFPGDEHVTLDESRILDSATHLGKDESGGEYPAGTWTQAHKYHDDDLWQLVSDGVISGFSIGGTIEEEIWYSPGAAPEDVRIPDVVADQLDEHGMDVADLDVREIVDLRTLEVSSVDYPAVPRATHSAHKSAGMEKAAPALTESVVDARRHLENRGHGEDEARRLAEYLDRAKSASSGGWIARAREFFSHGDDSKHSTGTVSAESDVDTVLQNMESEELEQSLNDIKAQNEKLSERVDSLSEKVDDESEGDDPDEKSTDEQIEELTEAMKTLGENQEQILGRVERVAEAGGLSQQKSDPNGEGADEPTGLAKTLGLENMGGS